MILTSINETLPNTLVRALRCETAKWLGLAWKDGSLWPLSAAPGSGWSYYLRRAGITAPVLAWLLAPGLPLHEGVAAGVDLSAASLAQLAEMVDGRARARGGRPGCTSRSTPGCPAAARPPPTGPRCSRRRPRPRPTAWSRSSGSGATSSTPTRPATRPSTGSWPSSPRALAIAERAGIAPALPAHRQLGGHADPPGHPLRPGPAGHRRLRPVAGAGRARYGLRPAMTARARVMLTKRVPAGQGVSYGHTYLTERETTLALVPLGYADGVPRHASNGGPVRLGRRANRTIAGRVCMDQFVLDCGDDPVARGRRGGPVRPRRRRRADRRRLGRGRRHHQLRDRDPVRRCAGATGLRRRAAVSRAARPAERLAGRAEPAQGGRACRRRGRCRRGRRRRRRGRRARPGPPARRDPSRPVRREPFGTLPLDETLTVPTTPTAPSCTSRWSSRPGRRRPPDRGLRARLLPGHGHLPLPAQAARRAGRAPDGLLRPARARPVRPAARPASTTSPRSAVAAAVLDATVPDGPHGAGRPLDGRHDHHGVRRAVPGAVRRPGGRRAC